MRLIKTRVGSGPKHRGYHFELSRHPAERVVLLRYEIRFYPPYSKNSDRLYLIQSWRNWIVFRV